MIRPPALLSSLVAAIPRAWAVDRVFRLAAIGAGVAFVMLLGGLAGGDGRPPAPGTKAPPLPAPGARYEPGPPPVEAAPEAPVGPIAPGRALNGIRIERDPNAPAERFGTMRAAEPQPPSKKAP